ncbi:MAG TPA: hypothetical protein VL001_03975 [Candidimonas sp.]|nr:hypothetical protein [Candidimonas sp.]
MARERRITELGEEVKCAKCNDFWPADSEFFFFNRGKPHSWCKDCYVNDDKMKAKVRRYIDKSRAPARAAA